MLKQETIQKIENLLKIKGLSEAIKAEAETDIEIPELSIYDATELETLKNNEYKNGKEKGVEMAVKDAKEKLGLDFQGKSIDGLLNSYQKKVLEDAKIEPAQKVQELNEKLTTLQNTVKEYETKLAEKDSEVEKTIVNTELYKHIPAPKEDGPAIDQEDIIYKMKREGYEFKREGEKVVAYKNGNKVTNKMSEDLPVKDVVESFLKEKKLFATPQPTPTGRGGQDTKATLKATKLSELKAQYQAEGKSLIGQEFMQAAQQHAKEVEGFDMNA
jgi:ribosomal protein S13